MNAVIARLQDEPVILSNLAAAVLALLIAFGAPISDDQKLAIIAVVGIVATLFARSKVSPV